MLEEARRHMKEKKVVLHRCYPLLLAHLFPISGWQASVELLALLASIPNGEWCPGAQDSVFKKPDSVIPDGSPGELEKGWILTPKTFSIILYLHAYVHTHIHINLTKRIHTWYKKTTPNHYTRNFQGKCKLLLEKEEILWKFSGKNH